jgi:2-haloacid dehalogenase
VSARAVVFDLYGTLLDIASVATKAEAAGARDPDAFVLAWRRKQLEYAFLTSLAGAYRDFDDLTALALEQTCAQLGLALDAPARDALANAWQELPVYRDVMPAIAALRARGIATAVLTNGTAPSVDAVLRHAHARELFDDVLSVDAVRVYKPHPRVYALATARFGCEPGEIAFVSSNGWDAWGAARFGFRVAWCNRSAFAAETLLPRPQATLGGLDELEAFVVR